MQCIAWNFNNVIKWFNRLCTSIEWNNAHQVPKIWRDGRTDWNERKKICLRNNNFPRISSKELVCVVDVGAAVVTVASCCWCSSGTTRFTKTFYIIIPHIGTAPLYFIIRAYRTIRRDYVVVFVDDTAAEVVSSLVDEVVNFWKTVFNNIIIFSV